MRLFAVISALLLSAAPGLAQGVGGDAARAQLFGDRVVVHYAEALGETERAIVAEVVSGQPYYGAVAYAPSEGLVSEPLSGAFNYHSAEPAQAAALRACNAKRSGGQPCRTAALLRPRGWSPRSLQLSQSASAGFRNSYGRGRGSKALAISPSTGKWAIARGEGAGLTALRSCATQSEAGDCQVVVRN